MPKSFAQIEGRGGGMDGTSWSRGGCGEPLPNQFEVSRKDKNVMCTSDHLNSAKKMDGGKGAI